MRPSSAKRPSSRGKRNFSYPLKQKGGTPSLDDDESLPLISAELAGIIHPTQKGKGNHENQSSPTLNVSSISEKIECIDWAKRQPSDLNLMWGPETTFWQSSTTRFTMQTRIVSTVHVGTMGWLVQQTEELISEVTEGALADTSFMSKRPTHLGTKPIQNVISRLQKHSVIVKNVGADDEIRFQSARALHNVQQGSDLRIVRECIHEFEKVTTAEVSQEEVPEEKVSQEKVSQSASPTTISRVLQSFTRSASQRR